YGDWSSDVCSSDLADDGSALAAGPNGIVVAPGAEWIFDYDRAVDEGMGITLTLALPNARVDQLFVFGVRASFDLERSQSELEGLLLAHRHTRGLAFVPQGTPTNNTESDRAGWQRTVGPRGPGRSAPAAPSDGSNAS